MRTLLLLSALVYALASCAELPAEPDARSPGGAAALLAGLPHGCSPAAPPGASPVAIVSSPRQTLSVELLAAPDRQARYQSHLLARPDGSACGRGLLEVAGHPAEGAGFVVRLGYTDATVRTEPDGAVRLDYQGLAELCVLDGSPCQMVSVDGVIHQRSPDEAPRVTLDMREAPGAPVAADCGCRVVPSQTKVIVLSP